jgi:hypothetical protein
VVGTPDGCELDDNDDDDNDDNDNDDDDDDDDRPVVVSSAPTSALTGCCSSTTARSPSPRGYAQRRIGGTARRRRISVRCRLLLTDGLGSATGWV